jgi:hypothetical protein
VIEDRRERFAEERPLLVNAARDLYARLGRGFSQGEWRREARVMLGESFRSGVSENTIKDRFGSWEAFLRCAGIPSWTESRRAEDRAKISIRAFEVDFERVAGLLHRPPTVTDYRRYGRFSYDPLARHLGLFNGQRKGVTDRLTSGSPAFDCDPAAVAPYFGRPFGASGPRKSEVRALFFALLPLLPGRHYVERVDADGAAIVTVTTQGAFRLEVEFGVRPRGRESKRRAVEVSRVLVCWDPSDDELTLSLSAYVKLAREVGLYRLVDLLPPRAFAKVHEPRSGSVPYFTRDPRNEAETIALFLMLLPHWGRVRLLGVEQRDSDEPNFDFDLLIYFHDAGGWRRCRVEAKLDARRFDKANGDQDLLVCWAAGGGSAGGLPVLSLERYLKETPHPGGPTLLDYLPELAVRLASNVLPIKSGRRP